MAQANWAKCGGGPKIESFFLPPCIRALFFTSTKPFSFLRQVRMERIVELFHHEEFVKFWEEENAKIQRR